MDFNNDLFQVVDRPKMPYEERKAHWKRGCWVNRELEIIPLKEMEADYLVRVYRLVEEAAQKRLGFILDRAVSSFLTPRGEFGDFEWEDHFDDVVGVSLDDVLFQHPFFLPLIKEVIRRGRHDRTWLARFGIDLDHLNETWNDLWVAK